MVDFVCVRGGAARVAGQHLGERLLRQARADVHGFETELAAYRHAVKGVRGERAGYCRNGAYRRDGGPDG